MRLQGSSALREEMRSSAANDVANSKLNEPSEMGTVAGSDTNAIYEFNPEWRRNYGRKCGLTYRRKSRCDPEKIISSALSPKQYPHHQSQPFDGASKTSFQKQRYTHFFAVCLQPLGRG